MEKLIEALKLIKKTCLKQGDYNCRTCPMYVDDYEGCLFYHEKPFNWDILATPETITRVVK